MNGTLFGFLKVRSLFSLNVVIILLGGLSSFSQASELTIAQALEQAKSHNPEIKKSLADIRLHHESIRLSARLNVHVFYIY